MSLHYGTYLHLEKILNSQELESSKAGQSCHDEHLFIVVHQIYELWFKQILLECQSIHKLLEKAPLPDSDLIVILNRLERCNTIWPILHDQITVMETMTPMDFLDFRHFLYPASGFQSLQFRLLETLLGLKYQDRTPEEKQFFSSRLNDSERKILEEFDKIKSIRELLDDWLARMPFFKNSHDPYWIKYQANINSHYEKDIDTIANHQFLTNEQKKHQISIIQNQLDSIKMIFDFEKFEVMRKKGEFVLSQKGFLSALFISLHRSEPLLQIPFKILQAIISFDSSLTKWRHAHSIMAQKMLGKKIGTGGSSGSDYLLQTALKHRLFTDLMNLSNYLLPSSHIPVLDSDQKELMQFKY